MSLNRANVRYKRRQKTTTQITSTGQDRPVFWLEAVMVLVVVGKRGQSDTVSDEMDSEKGRKVAPDKKPDTDVEESGCRPVPPGAACCWPSRSGNL